MAEKFVYLSKSRLDMRDGFRQARLGDIPEPVIYGAQGKLLEVYGSPDLPPRPSTLDQIVAAVAG
jgi:hypothetical protein